MTHYTSLIGRGMVRTSALIVIAKKLLRIIHAMVRDDRDYIRNYASPKRVDDKKGSIGYNCVGGEIFVFFH